MIYIQGRQMIAPKLLNIHFCIIEGNHWLALTPKWKSQGLGLETELGVIATALQV